MMTKRIQLSRKKGHHKPPGAINVARPTKWGNPFKWTESGTDNVKLAKAAVRHSYRSWLNGDFPHFEPNRRQWILDHLPELRGKDLACWCKLCDKHKSGKPLNERCEDCDPCHADVLGRLTVQGALSAGVG